MTQSVFLSLLLIFLLSCLFFFLPICRSLCFIWIQVLCQLRVWQTSFPTLGIPFFTSLLCLGRTKVLHLDVIQFLHFFSFLDTPFVSYPKVINISHILKAFIVLPFKFRVTSHVELIVS